MHQMKQMILTWRKTTLKVRMFYGTFHSFHLKTRQKDLVYTSTNKSDTQFTHKQEVL